jgi:hypothetical protein
MKISFDYDNTLIYLCIQEFAKELVDKGLNVHIVTSRPSSGGLGWNNDELFEVADTIGIKKENIHFTEYCWKYKFFNREGNEDFVFHLDDDDSEVDEINEKTRYVKGILFDENWKENCLKTLTE